MKKKSLRLILLLVAVTAVIIAQSVKTGSIRGTITNAASQQPIPKVDVHILRNRKTISSGKSDQNGSFNFSSLAIGTYDLEATCASYDTFRISAIQLHEGKITVADIQLKPAFAINTPDAERKVVYDLAEQNVGLSSPLSCTKNNEKKDYGAASGLKEEMDYEQNEHFNTEAYDKIDENEFREVSKNPLSTFSIDVDAASYSNVRRFINQGTLPTKDAVRIEEMINYFTYDYPAPQGNDPFSISTEAAVCPWNEKHQLIHIGLKGKEIKTENLPANNLTFLIDVSGSMDEPNKLPLLKNAFHLLVDQIRAIDRVAIVVYAGNAGLVLPSTPGNQKEKILAAIDGLEAGGSTAGGQGIKLAYKIAKENLLSAGNNRVILATDGDFNVGASSDGELIRLIEEEREHDIFLTVLGFGMGNYKDSKMEKLADKGNGNYAYIDNIMEANKVFVKEMGATLFTIAKDVKLQIEFNPQKIKAYRLVGYENRLLANEDFKNDKKDAGELGSGHCVTAMYEIIPAGSNEAVNPIDSLKYQQSKTTDIKSIRNEMMTVKFRYKEPKESTSKEIIKVLNDEHGDHAVSENFRFSAAVAEVGMLLRDSKFKGQSSFGSAIALARESKGKDAEGYRSEFIRLAETAEMLSRGTSKK